MISALISAVILIGIIKAYTSADEVSFVGAFLGCLGLGFVTAIINRIVAANITSVGAAVATSLIINVVLTGFVVNLLCSTTAKKVVLITLTYVVVQVVLAFAFGVGLVLLVSAL